MLTGTMPSSLYLSEAVDVPKIILTVAFGKLHDVLLVKQHVDWKNGEIKDISVQSS
jgi:hypothetical protein